MGNRPKELEWLAKVTQWIRFAFKEIVLWSVALALLSAWKTDLPEAENIQVSTQIFILPWGTNHVFGVNSWLPGHRHSLQTLLKRSFWFVGPGQGLRTCIFDELSLVIQFCWSSDHTCSSKALAHYLTVFSSYCISQCNIVIFICAYVHCSFLPTRYRLPEWGAFFVSCSITDSGPAQCKHTVSFQSMRSPGIQREPSSGGQGPYLVFSWPCGSAKGRGTQQGLSD